MDEPPVVCTRKERVDFMHGRLKAPADGFEAMGLVECEMATLMGLIPSGEELPHGSFFRL